MTDIVSPEVRSRMMSGIRGRDTKPEMIIRKALHAAGFRYRLHDRKLPGSPDLVFPGRRAVLFVHGCFWHGHGCHLFRLPGTRTEFWWEKITGNVERDSAAARKLHSAGWRVGIVWECALKGKEKQPVQEITTALVAWLRSGEDALELRGMA